MVDRPTYPDRDPSDHDDDDDDGDVLRRPTIGDTLTCWRYTLTPTLYVDEDSDTGNLLWQNVLEQRAVRAWLIVACVLLGLLLVTGMTFTFILAAVP